MKTIKNIGAVALMCLFLFSGYAFIQKDNKGKKDDSHQKGKDDDHKGHDHEKGKGHDDHKDKDKNHGKGDDHDKSNKDKAKDKMDDVMGKGNDNDNNKDKDRDDNGKWKKKGDREKITVCHKAKSNPVTINISDRAWKAHEAHGDTRGECPARKVTTDGSEKDDDKIEKKRRTFYDKVVEAEETIIDSKDVLDIAKEKMQRTMASIEAARIAKTLADEEITVRETKVARVATLIKEVDDLIQLTNQKVNVNVDLVEVDMTATN